MMTVSLDSMVDSCFYIKKSSDHGVMPDLLPPIPEPLDTAENKPLPEQSVINQPLSKNDLEVGDSTHKEDEVVKDDKTCSEPPSDEQYELPPQDDVFEKDTSPIHRQQDNDYIDSIQQPSRSSISSDNFDPYEKPDEDMPDGSIINLLHGKKESCREPEMIPMQDLADLPDNQCAITVISRRSRYRAGTCHELVCYYYLNQVLDIDEEVSIPLEQLLTLWKLNR